MGEERYRVVAGRQSLRTTALSFRAIGLQFCFLYTTRLATQLLLKKRNGRGLGFPKKDSPAVVYTLDNGLPGILSNQAGVRGMLSLFSRQAKGIFETLS